MFGVMLNQRRHAFMIYIVMLGFLVTALCIGLWSEHQPNASLEAENILEGKEMRFSKADAILFGIATTASSNGSVNAMHDSFSPLAGGMALVQILLGEIIFGGVGSGLYGMLLYVLLAVFLAGLMVGRTPEYLGKKIEVFEMQMAVLALVLPSAIVLIGSGITTLLPSTTMGVLNRGPHGLSEIIYAWASAANNNGSAFAGLSVNNDFYNLGLSLAMLIGRFGVMIPVLAIAGNLAQKKQLSKTLATLSTDTPVFSVLLIFVVVIMGALTFLPVLMLGPVIEHLLMLLGQSF